MMTQTDYVILWMGLGALAFWLVMRYAKRFKGKTIQKRGKKGEEMAISLLKADGYRIVDRQVTKKTSINIDGRCHESKIHADLIVQKGLKCYVVEVKTGNQTNPAVANVRRQLLEYCLVFEPDGMLFVDVEKKKIRQVSFDGQFGAIVSRRIRFVVVSFFVGVICCWLVVELLVK